MPASVQSGIERWLEDGSAPESAAPDSSANPPLRIALAYDPFPKQRAFHASRAKYRLFGGAAGPGKSKALLIEAILQAQENPGANTLLLRRTFPELEQSLLLYFRRDVPRELYRSFNESKHLVTWWNGSTTRFGYCASEYDVYQYQGAEFLFIGIDELTMFTLRQWQFLTSRNRCPLAGAFPCMAGATNPGNIGHAWVKSLWIDRQAAAGMDDPAAYDPDDYEFIAARVTDNPIYARDENYLKTLRALPSHLRRAFLDGDWEVFAGQYFDRFDASRHVIRPEHIEWKPWWPRWVSIDWGFEHPAAVYWHALAPFSGTGAAPASDSWRDAAHPAESTCAPESVECGALAPLSLPRGLARGAAPEIANPVPSGVENEICAGSGAVKPAPQTAAPFDQKGYRTPRDARPGETAHDGAARIVTYREYVTRRTSPRELARQIVERSLLSGSTVSPGSAMAHPRQGSAPGTTCCAPTNDPSAVSVGARHAVPATNAWLDSYYSGSSASPDPREKIDAVYLSPDAFARRTDEASIADQIGDVLVAAGLPRPVPADDDRVGGWMLMYQMLDADEWLLTENCIELIRTLPTLIRDPARVEDIEKMDGDDPADAARYGLKSRYGASYGRAGSFRSRMPLADRLAARVLSPDPTIRALQARKAQLEESRASHPVSFARHSRRR